MNMATITLIILILLLIAVAVIDAKTMEIPLVLNISIFLLGIVSIWTIGEPSIISRLIGMIIISLPMLVTVYFIPGGFGGGDIKLMAAVGFFIGWKLNLVAFFLALLAGGAWGIILLLTKKAGKKDHFAFGPFLCGGIIIALFVGDELVNWYLNLGPSLLGMR